MAMVVKNNMSAVRTLNTLNKNSSALQKSLQKVSSGMKINSAQDDASGYAISEKMRVQIRSLDQANQNTQNASSLMKTAEGAVSSTVEILKSLKEKAINAATDTNTDSDRATIQKELDQFIDQIDDNALTTFNGKYLVDGSKNNAHMNTRSAFTNQSMAIETTGQTYLADDNTADNGVASTDTAKNRTGESLEISSTDYVTASFVKDGKTYTTTYQVANTKIEDIFKNLNSEYANQTNDITPAFGPGGSTSSTPTAAEIVAGLSDKDLASIAKDGKASSVITGAADSDALVAALTELSSTSAADVTAKTRALAAEVAAITVDGANNNNAVISFTASDGTTSIDTSTNLKSQTGAALSAQTGETTPRAFSDAIAAEAAAWAVKEAANGTTSGEDMAQSVATDLNVTVGAGITESSPKIGDVINANKKEFHELTRAALVDAAAQKFAPVTVSDKSLVDGSTITTDTSATYTAQAKGITGYTDGDSGSTDQDTDLQAIATGIATAVTAGNGKSAATQTGDELLANLQADLANTDVTTAFATDTTTANTLDTYKHIVDAYAAKYVDANVSTTTTTTTSGPAHAEDTDIIDSTNMVHAGTDIGTNKSGDQVDTNDGTSGLTVTASTAGVKGQISGVTISISDSDGNVKKAANAALDQFSMSIRAENRTTAVDGNNNLTFQVGAAANQSIAVSLTDMRSEALGLKGSDGTKVSVATKDKANAAVAVFDNAIQKAIDQQTTIGAVEARLDYTSQNLTTSSENVQAAESTIRDADMAKEMTNYTKNNVLLQAAQSMLAQANQSSSQVLSLLQ